jgi:hypothetical protein
MWLICSLLRKEYNNLKLAKALWEGDQEVAYRSGRNEPISFAIHKCMEATLGISVYSYLYPKLAKTMYLCYYLMFSL